MCASTLAQTRTVNECPKITLECPEGSVPRGRPFTFVAIVRGANPTGYYTFNWKTTAGKIISEATGDQGIASIVIDQTDLEINSFKVTVEVGGFLEGCPRIASCEVELEPRCRLTKFDEYGNLSFNDEMKRLDNFSIQLQNEPGTTGYIVAYAGRKARIGEAKEHANGARDYLIKKRGINAARVVIIDGGHREDLTVELYVIPLGEPIPVASPSVDRSEAEIIKDKKVRAKSSQPRLN